MEYYLGGIPEVGEVPFLSASGPDAPFQDWITNVI